MSSAGSTQIDSPGAGGIYAPMAVESAADWYVQQARNEGFYALAGCQVTASGTAGHLDRAAGPTRFGTGVPQNLAVVTAFATTITTLASGLSSGQALWVACEDDPSSGFQLNAGTGAQADTTHSPVKPTPTSGRVVQAWVYVPFGATAVDALTGTANGNAKILPAQQLSPVIAAGLHGDGSDGAVLLDGTTTASATAAGITRASTVYNLTRDIYCTTLTLTGGAFIIPNGYRIFVSVALVVNVNFTIVANEHDASAGTGGGAIAAAYLAGSAGGGNGAAGTTGAAGANVTAALGGAGGAGGLNTGSPATGGGTAGGTVTAPTANQGGPPHNVAQALSGVCGSTTPTLYAGGGGGSAGTASAGTGVGGGGAGGGGVLVISAASIQIAAGVNLNLSAPGGTGGNAVVGSSTNVGGGGGGGGGAVILVYGYKLLTGTLTFNVAGGNGGTGVGTGRAGAVGSAGNTYQLCVA